MSIYMIDGNPIFTIFTPAYNAGKTLDRVYKSLLRQTLRDFEWIVVDDGSTDRTAELVAGWLESKKTWFPIRYVYQNNRHKKVAHNQAVSLARGEFFLPLDADDRCTEWALETLYTTWCAIPNNARSGFAGVCCLCQYEDGQIVGDPFPGSQYWDAPPQEILHRYKVRGEKWGFNRTDILKEFPFREDIPGYVPESLVWDAIGRRYKTRFFNEPLRIYYQQSQREKAEPSVKLRRFREPGRLAHKKEKLNNDLIWLAEDPIYFLKEAVWVGRFTLHVEKGQRGLATLNNRVALALVWMTFPIAAFVFYKDTLEAWRASRRQKQ